MFVLILIVRVRFPFFAKEGINTALHEFEVRMSIIVCCYVSHGNDMECV